MSNEKPLLVILGPTASGKTHLAVQIASALGGEIISADSRQVYREMNIGTGKDLEEYRVGGTPVPYHLIDIADPGSQYNVNDFQHDFEGIHQHIIAKGSVPILCGGTGFYIYALLKGHAYSAIPVNTQLRQDLEQLPVEELNQRLERYETEYQKLADTSTRKRLIRAIEISEYLTAFPEAGIQFTKPGIDQHSIIFGLNPPVEIRRAKISARLDQRLASGLIEEVEQLLKKLSPEQLIYYGLEYKYITQYLIGEMDFAAMKARLETEIHRFAKRQMTFFRKMEKDGLRIHWLSHESTEAEKVDFISEQYLAFGSAKSRS
ncbi:tRNA (adenosine(37)-N6)-dimethylallyltransferase MiaA [Dyadobacter aurulentus]|uniref:tRNA (adenosine(37)-N6)-dimethylallyltransferase MiaA n=1 Tax=Dyadobacter sp. UC 10 TaxID=2605428 RepID=UPI0011F136E2|nr:tRNA (adenosine(37)-N6)-dimethylallyltransferase MiaA [Dyadobacter sp. UC 10]KAA0993435.1 tRNA (adenosine(37)-N6)-dimethylallyltransferase MiaA [Dyadobacter sp. UC 10]